MKLKCMSIVGVLLLVAAGLFAGGRGDSSASSAGSDAALEFTALATQYQLPPRPTDPFWTDMEKRFNVKYRINWVQDSSWSETLGRLVATDALPEVVQINNQADAGFVQAVEAGMFWDLTPYLDWNQYPNLGKISTNAWMNSKYQGKNYIIPSSRGQYDSGWFIRTDVLAKYNLPRPTTLAQFNAYMDACLKEGIIPIPYWIQKEITRFQDCFGDGNMIPVYTADNTGIVPNILTESYALAVDYFRDCYTKGYLAREFANVDPSQTENFLVTGKGGIYFKNAWHRYRLNDELHKVVPAGETEPIFFLEGPGGISVWYDQGFYGGMAISKKVPESKMKRIIGFYNETSNPDMVNYFQYGIPGVHHNVVDGFPQFTEQGRREINNTTYIPFMLATTTWIKVDSPLAPPEYNLESREMISVIDDVAEKIGKAPFQTFSIISSRSYARFWAQYQNDFYAAVVDTITGVRTPAQFRAYQQQLLRLPDVQAAERELKQSWDSYGLVNWKPSN